MKINSVLAKHPWPWFVIRRHDEWAVFCENGQRVFDDGSAGEGVGPQMSDEVRDAILELIESHVNRTTTQRTHSPDCWQWHLECAVSKIKGMIEEKP